MDGTIIEESKEERRFSQEQYDMLKLCSDKEDMTEWNQWRNKKENRNMDIELEGASLDGCYLKDVYLNLRGCVFLNEEETLGTSR
jgi:hypothetical protein